MREEKEEKTNQEEERKGGDELRRAQPVGCLHRVTHQRPSTPVCHTKINSSSPLKFQLLMQSASTNSSLSSRRRSSGAVRHESWVLFCYRVLNCQLPNSPDLSCPVPLPSRPGHCTGKKSKKGRKKNTITPTTIKTRILCGGHHNKQHPCRQQKNKVGRIGLRNAPAC